MSLKISSSLKAALLLGFAGIALFLLQCKVEPNEPKNKQPPHNLTVIDSGRVGFLLPSDTSGSAALTNVIAQGNDGATLYAVKIGEKKDNALIFDVKRVDFPFAIDMEYAFIEYVLKYQDDSGENASYTLDYGVYDIDGKRMRYKSVLKSKGSVLKIMYYLMRDDNDDHFYELTVATKLENAANADSVIKQIAESFWFLK